MGTKSVIVQVVLACLLVATTGHAATTQLWFAEVAGSPDQIAYTDSDGTAAVTAKSVANSTIVDIYYDRTNKKVYWADQDATSATGLSYMDPDGSNTVKIFSSPACGVAVDETNSSLYFSDCSAGNIYKANLDGSSATAIVTGMTGAGALSLDVGNGKGYVIDYAASGAVGGAYSFNLDGSGTNGGLTSLYTTSLGNEPYNGIAVDTTNGKIFFTARASSTIYKCDIDGSNQQSFDTGSSFTGVTVAAWDNKLYAVYLNQYIVSYDLTGTNASKSAVYSHGSSVNPTAVFAVPYTPSVTSTAASSITSSTATVGGNVNSDGGFSVTARGVCWNTSTNPTLSSNIGCTSDGTGTGSFTSSITGLSPSTTYYVAAYATNSQGTGYGSSKSFTTSSDGGGGGSSVDDKGWFVLVFLLFGTGIWYRSRKRRQ